MKTKLTVALILSISILLAGCGPGPQGPAGRDGVDGVNGQDGSNGTNGQDGNSVVPVKFCNAETTYPSSFPEYGLCINNALYAVYWDKTNSWLAKIANGTYQSTATGLQCTFDVVGCSVTIH